jgi:hypothetical protein
MPRISTTRASVSGLIRPAIGLAVGETLDILLGPDIQHTSTDSAPNRFLSATRPYGFGTFNQAGLRTGRDIQAFRRPGQRGRASTRITERSSRQTLATSPPYSIFARRSRRRPSPEAHLIRCRCRRILSSSCGRARKKSSATFRSMKRRRLEARAQRDTSTHSAMPETQRCSPRPSFAFRSSISS